MNVVYWAADAIRYEKKSAIEREGKRKDREAAQQRWQEEHTAENKAKAELDKMNRDKAVQAEAKKLVEETAQEKRLKKQRLNKLMRCVACSIVSLTAEGGIAARLGAKPHSSGASTLCARKRRAPNGNFLRACKRFTRGIDCSLASFNALNSPLGTSRWKCARRKTQRMTKRNTERRRKRWCR